MRYLVASRHTCAGGYGDNGIRRQSSGQLCAALALSTVVAPNYQLGESAARLLLLGKTEGTSESKSVLFPVELKLRETTRNNVKSIETSYRFRPRHGKSDVTKVSSETGFGFVDNPFFLI